jgi:predicted AAA+ superfamily ATPase
MYNYHEKEDIAMLLQGILSDMNPWWGNPDRRAATHCPVKRYVFKAVFEQLTNMSDRRAVLLLGLRQVGKTVLLGQLADSLLDAGWPPQNITYFDFDDDRLTAEISPREVAEVVPSASDGSCPRVFLFDEVHRATAWGPWLKKAVDTTRDRYIVTDSAATLMRTAATESGLGRWDEYRMEGLSFREFLELHAAPSEKDLKDVLRRLPNPPPQYFLNGGFPEHRDNDRLEQVRRRIRTDIVDRAILRDLLRSGAEVQRVRDLFVYLVQDSGAIWDARARGRDLEADARSVRDWVRLLEETMLIVPLERKTGSAASGLRSRPRYYAADHGLIAAFSDSPRPEVDERVTAQVFEAVVFRHLRQAAQATTASIHYFREKDDLEADFVYEDARGPVAIEVTASSRPRTEKQTRLQEAGRRLRARKCLLVYGGLVREQRQEIDLVPLQDFLFDPEAVVQEG